MKRALVAMIVSLFSTPIWAAEFYIMRDLTTQKCTVVDKRPMTAVKTITLASDAIYKSRGDAESAMKAIKSVFFSEMKLMAPAATRAGS